MAACHANYTKLYIIDLSLRHQSETVSYTPQKVGEFVCQQELVRSLEASVSYILVLTSREGKVDKPLLQGGLLESLRIGQRCPQVNYRHWLRRYGAKLHHHQCGRICLLPLNADSSQPPWEQKDSLTNGNTWYDQQVVGCLRIMQDGYPPERASFVRMNDFGQCVVWMSTKRPSKK